MSVRLAWNSASGNGTQISFMILPPAAVKPSLKPPIDSSPAAYFHAMVMTLRWPLSYMTLPIGYDGCQLLNEVRKTLGAQAARVMASAPAFGQIIIVSSSRATLA